MSQELVKEMSDAYRLTAWTGVGAIYGNAELVTATRRIIKKLLKGHVKQLQFINDKRLNTAQKLLSLTPAGKRVQLQQKLNSLAATLQIMGGKPSQIALPLAYWRSESDPDPETLLNPAQDECGLIWFAPLIPMKPAAVRTFVKIVENIGKQYSIEPLITLTSLSPYCFDSTIPILFDRNDPKAVAKAHTCYEALFKAAREQGFVPYRLGVHAMKLLTDSDSVALQVNSTLKQALDPDNILAPGRYSKF